MYFFDEDTSFVSINMFSVMEFNGVLKFRNNLIRLHFTYSTCATPESGKSNLKFMRAELHE